MSYLILPGDDIYYETLGSIMPYDWRQVAEKYNDFIFVARAGSGILEAVPHSVADEYVYGGEYDERLNEIEEEEDWYSEESDYDNILWNDMTLVEHGLI